MPEVPARKAIPHCQSYNRVVGCQGSIQLVTATAALMQHDARLEEGVRRRNWLVIHDLYSPHQQDAEFAGCLQHLAKSVGAWEKVIYLSPKEVSNLTRIARRNGHVAATDQLRKWLDLPEIHEIYLSQNRILLNDLFGQLFSDARKTCYGDGVGVNFSAKYFMPQQSPSAIKSWRRRIAKSFRWLLDLVRRSPAAAPPIEFDRHCLLLPNLFDETLLRYEQLDRSLILDIFQQLHTATQPELANIMAEWSTAIRGASKVVVLLTSNFSEAGRISEGHEIEAYLDLVKVECPTRSAVILVKPHPRDSATKIERLVELLKQTHAKVFVLADPLSFYLPFEVILHAMILCDDQLIRRTSVICVSSSCLSLELLYGVRCKLGFGERVVRECFSETWREPRIRHERDLHAAMQIIRHNNALQAA